MDVVVKGHHCEVSDRFRQYVEEKLERIEKVDHRVLRCEVEVSQEKNPRQHDRAMRVEHTMYTKGPVLRAEACGETKQAAFDVSLDRLRAQVRKAADRRRVHTGQHAPEGLRHVAASGPRFRAVLVPWRTGVRAASLTSSRPRRGCLTGRRFRPCTT